MNKRADFIEYYSKWYDVAFLETLTKSQKCLRLHLPNLGDTVLRHFLLELDLRYVDPYDWFRSAYPLPDDYDLKNINADDPRYYVMDAASILPVLALDLKSGDKVLDLCAAPGGKSLVIAQILQAGELVANEIMDSRFARLWDNFKRMKVNDAVLLNESPRILATRYENYFDKILADVPCSMEAHVLANPMELKKWSPTRSPLLAKRQHKIIKAAVAMLKPGGRLVYSTCSISPHENEMNIEFFLNKYDLKLIDVAPPVKLLKKSYGYLALPTLHQMGPLYYCVMEKN